MQKKNVIALSIIFVFLFLTGIPADASVEKQQPPISPPGTPKTVRVVLKRIPVIATMYYAPEKGQERYVRGSYKKDVQLNGKGEETFSGTKPDLGTAAADWQILKKGTNFRLLECDDILLGRYHHIPAQNIIFEVQDTGSGVKGRRIDLFAGRGDHGRKIAEKFGSRKMVIEVIQCIPQK
ncbi:MAG TPA: 3D domain-containing protein [Candidatus Bathyarchaeia archaeon]|nr:3D domain-containing protein [Candidatus Bathyarchaeia archaeon]